MLRRLSCRLSRRGGVALLAAVDRRAELVRETGGWPSGCRGAEKAGRGLARRAEREGGWEEEDEEKAERLKDNAERVEAIEAHAVRAAGGAPVLERADG